MSKMESMPVARSDKDSDEMAAYTVSPSQKEIKGAWLGFGRTLYDTEGNIRN
jgi:hypothetical protein